MMEPTALIRTHSPGDPGEETDSHRPGFGEPVTGVVCASGRDGTGDGDRPPSSEPDSPGDTCEEDNSTRTRFGEPIIGVIHTSSPVGPCDEDSSPPTGFVAPLCQFVCVYQPGPSGLGNEFGDIYKWTDVSAPGDVIVMSVGCQELPPETFDEPCFDKAGVLCCEEVIALPFCSPGVTFNIDCTELKPLGGWFAATRG